MKPKLYFLSQKRWSPFKEKRTLEKSDRYFGQQFFKLKEKNLNFLLFSSTRDRKERFAAAKNDINFLHFLQHTKTNRYLAQNNFERKNCLLAFLNGVFWKPKMGLLKQKIQALSRIWTHDHPIVGRLLKCWATATAFHSTIELKNYAEFK